MHNVNSSIFWPAFNSLEWLSQSNKARLLQWKAYIDLTMYASRSAPELHLNEITDYVPASQSPNQTSWDGVFQRLYQYSLDGKDDGHAVKLGRAVKNAEQVSRGFEAREGFRVEGGMWGKIANMVIDSVEDSGETWIRGAGFDEAWENFGERKRKGGASL